MHEINCMRLKRHRVASGSSFPVKRWKMKIIVESQTTAAMMNIKIYVENFYERKKHGEKVR